MCEVCVCIHALVYMYILFSLKRIPIALGLPARDCVGCVEMLFQIALALALVLAARDGAGKPHCVIVVHGLDVLCQIATALGLVRAERALLPHNIALAVCICEMLLHVVLTLTFVSTAFVLAHVRVARR